MAYTQLSPTATPGRRYFKEAPAVVVPIEVGGVIGGGGLSRGPELLLQKDRKRYDAQIRRIQREDDEILEVLMQAVLMDIL